MPGSTRGTMPDGPPRLQPPVRIAVVDDEALARQRVLGLLSTEPAIEITGEYDTGMRALAGLSENPRPELVFLDVEMPDLDGLEVLESLAADERPEIVLVTGYDRYMERAFELHAVDYLRKPFTDERFASALAAARRRVLARRHEALLTGQASARAPVEAPTNHDAMLASVRDRRRETRIAIYNREQGIWERLPKQSIDYIEAHADAQVNVYASGRTYVWRKTLNEAEQLLDPSMFLRVHRSFIVNAERVDRIKALSKGEYSLFIGGKLVVDSGRTYRDVVEALLGDR
jgi:two-component system, LytTR family, response regulator